ncbi:MAG TPA: HAMP domain-containing sensor histidine kinase [Actinomycetota bacterium]
MAAGGDTIERTDAAPAAPLPSATKVSLLEVWLVLPTTAWLCWKAWEADWTAVGWGALFFVICIAAVDLIPIPAWGDIELSLSFPIAIGVAMLYPPAVAGLIAAVGSCDLHEFRRDTPLMRALWNRMQMALAIVAASTVFHQLAHVSDPWWTLVPAALAATISAYLINALLVALHASYQYGMTLRRVLAKMHGSRPVEFLLSYLGLALFGVVIARFFIEEGAWSVVVFLAPLVFARQMYFRSRVLADRLAEQNELLAEQAEHLEKLLRKETATVDQLRELNRMKGEFVATVSHELRTPITALIGYAKTLRQPQFSEDAAIREEFLERMERQGNRLVGLVENLLLTSRLENDQLSLSIGRVLFEDLAREVVEGLGNDAERIRVAIPDDLPVLHTDRQHLGRVMSNLIDNALKYSAEDGAVELGARAEGPDVVFWVADRGVGIEPEYLVRIFERFYQVDSSHTRRFRGAGLGLSMVRELVQHLGGSVHVESALGEGSTFSVRLPVEGPAHTTTP